MSKNSFYSTEAEHWCAPSASQLGQMEKNPPKIRLSPFPLITDTFYPKGSGLKNCAQPPQSISKNL